MKYAFLRVSTDRQAKEGHSLEAQEELLKPLVDKMFIDAGKSAKLKEDHTDFSYINNRYRIEINLDNRPEFKKMIQLLKEGDEVYFTKWDRISRSLFMLEAFCFHCKKLKVKLVPVRDTDNPLTRMIIGSVAQNEIYNLSDRIDQTSKLKFSKSQHLYKDPFGYKRNKRSKETGKLPYPEQEENILVIIPSEANIVRQIYTMATTMTPQEIADTYPNKPFCHRQTIANILKNDIYTGKIHLGKETKQGKHQPIITEEEYKKINT